MAPHIHKEIQNFKEQARKAKDLGENGNFLNEGLSEMQKARERIEYYKRNGYTSGPVPQDVVDQASRAIEQMTAAMDEKIKSYAKGRHCKSGLILIMRTLKKKTFAKNGQVARTTIR